MSIIGSWTSIKPALLTQSRRGGSSVRDRSSSIPCFRSHSKSSTPSGRDIAAKSGFSIQVNPGGWDMVANHGACYLAAGLAPHGASSAAKYVKEEIIFNHPGEVSGRIGPGDGSPAPKPWDRRPENRLSFRWKSRERRRPRSPEPERPTRHPTRCPPP